MNAAEIAAEALRLIAGDRCERSTHGRCSDPNSGYTRGATYEADAWCDACIAHDALTRMGTGESPSRTREQIALDDLAETRRELAELRAATETFGHHWERLATSASHILRIEQDVTRAIELARGRASQETP